MIGSAIRDKDGVAAAVWSCSWQRSEEGPECLQVFFAELVAKLHSEGKTASEFLQELYDRYVKLVRGTIDVCQSCVCVARYGYFEVSCFCANQYNASYFLSDKEQLFRLRRPPGH